MSQRNFEAVQKLLHLDVDYPQFTSWNENLKFEVDGVIVTAMATHSWRYESVKVIEPFEVDGSDYGQGYSPPLFALGISMLKQKEWLLKKGMTLTDESIRMATIVYRRHEVYLRNKITIESAQSAIWSKHRSRLESLEASNVKDQIRIANEKSVLRQQFKVSQIDQQTYQLELKRLTKEALESSQPYNALNKKIETGYEEIKQTMIDKLLAE